MVLINGGDRSGRRSDENWVEQRMAIWLLLHLPAFRGVLGEYLRSSYIQNGGGFFLRAAS